MTDEGFIEEFRRLRARIDEVDRALVELLAERLERAAEIGALKRAAGLPVVDPEREAEIRARVAATAAGRLSATECDRLYDVLLSLARARASGRPA